MLSPRFAILITASRRGKVRVMPGEVDGIGPIPVGIVAGSSAGSDRQRETDRDLWLGEEDEDRFALVFADRPVGCSNTAKSAVDDPALRGWGLAFGNGWTGTRLDITGVAETARSGTGFTTWALIARSYAFSRTISTSMPSSRSESESSSSEYRSSESIAPKRVSSISKPNEDAGDE